LVWFTGKGGRSKGSAKETDDKIDLERSKHTGRRRKTRSIHKSWRIRYLILEYWLVQGHLNNPEKATGDSTDITKTH